MWCGECYTSSPESEFHVADPENLYGAGGDEDRLESGWAPKERDRIRYGEARDRDDLLVPFECDCCVFAKRTGRVCEDQPNEKDAFLMSCIRRVILDGFWSRSRATVVNNTRLFREMMSLSKALGFEPPYEPPGPLPAFDHCGYRVAILMVVKSLRAGRNASTHIKWDTIRRLRSTHSNQSRASKEANEMSWAMSDYKGSGYDRLTPEKCGSMWFHRFSTGCRRRMGQDWNPNQAISNPLMVKLLSTVEAKVKMSEDADERYRWVMAGCYFCFCYVVSLRGSEGLMVDVAGLSDLGIAKPGFVIIPLLGQVKGEDHTRQHLIHCVNVTDSGIQVRKWVTRLKKLHEVTGRVKGPAFVKPSTGKQSTATDLNDLFIQILTEIYDNHPGMFEIDIESASDVSERYHISRSFRRGSESRATSKGVSTGDCYQVNRWRKKEKAGASKMSQPIHQVYVDVTLVKEAFMRYTKAM